MKTDKIETNTLTFILFSKNEKFTSRFHTNESVLDDINSANAMSTSKK